MVIRIIERIKRARLLDELVVVTSNQASDDQLTEIVTTYGTAVRRGPLEDVLARFEAVRLEFKPEVIVRLTGDNALTDPGVIDLIVSSHEDLGTDYTSNTLERTFPHGLDVECFNAQAMIRLQQRELTNDEREHVTLGMYTRPDLFSLGSVTQETDQSSLRWTVDYPEDLTFVRSIYAELLPKSPDFDMREVLHLLSEKPHLSRRGTDITL